MMYFLVLITCLAATTLFADEKAQIGGGIMSPPDTKKEMFHDRVTKTASGGFGRVVQGDNKYVGKVHFAVAIYYMNKLECTSSIITVNHILTAAHCIYKDQRTRAYYGVANVNRTASSLKISFSRFTIHPDYKPKPDYINDIAILTTEDLVFNRDIHPVCLVGPGFLAPENQIVVAIGWGDTVSGNHNTKPELLRYVEQTVVNPSLCKKFSKSPTDHFVCAGGSNTGVCNGDSGGPLVVFMNEAVQIGIFSLFDGSEGCGKQEPEAWTSVSYFNLFINEITNGVACFRTI